MTFAFSLIKPLFDAILQLATFLKSADKEKLKEHVDPVFQAFEAVHTKYLNSFAEYRGLLQASIDPVELRHSIIERIRRDNLFSDHERSRVLQISGATEDPQLLGFIAAIRDYLVDARTALEPADEYRARKFRNPQLWRRTLIAELESIFEERWQPVLDPGSSAPPLYGSELDEALRNVCREARIEYSSADGISRLKVYLATRAVDEVVDEMQEAYARVAAEYGALNAKLKHL